MELKTFITETLTQIVHGVKESQPVIKEAGGQASLNCFEQINGDVPYGKQTAMRGYAYPITSVEFEVSLTNDTQNGNAIGIGVLFGAISFGGKNSKEEREISLTKVKFSVPIVLP